MITFYDIETNGLKTDSEILEFGFVRCKEDFTLVSAGQLFFWQDGWYVGHTDVHGLTKEYLEPYAPDFVVNMAQLYAIMKEGNIVGKNNHAFDDRVLNSFMQRHTFAQDKSVSLITTYQTSADIQKTHGAKWRSLMKEKGYDPGNKRGTLEDYLSIIGYGPETIAKYCELCGIKMRDNLMHSAAVDAMATYFVSRIYAIKFGIVPEFV